MKQQEQTVGETLRSLEIRHDEGIKSIKFNDEGELLKEIINGEDRPRDGERVLVHSSVLELKKSEGKWRAKDCYSFAVYDAETNSLSGEKKIPDGYEVILLPMTSVVDHSEDGEGESNELTRVVFAEDVLSGKENELELEEFLQKKAFVKKIEEALKGPAPYEKERTFFRWIKKIELQVFLKPKKDCKCKTKDTTESSSKKNLYDLFSGEERLCDSFWEQEMLVMTFNNDAYEVSNNNYNSLSATFRNIGEMLDGGKYDLVDEYRSIVKGTGIDDDGGWIELRSREEGGGPNEHYAESLKHRE